MTPCPTCQKPLSRRWALNKGLAPAVPAHFGPFRRDAVLTSQKGWCAWCDERPIKNWRPGLRRYLCGQKRCLYRWRYLTRLDHEHAAKESSRASVG